MLIKSNRDEIQSYLSDASYMREGHAESVVLPETTNEVSEVLARADRDRIPVTVSGAGTGTVGGRVAFGGIVLATDKLNHIERITREYAIAEAGVVLSDFQQAVDHEGLLYPPDPTERGCFLGGTVATNASGSRTFKYGPTRNYINWLKIVLPGGDVLELRRGEQQSQLGELKIPLSSGRVISATLPSYQLPITRKNASGYFVAPDMDVIDLFIGSEGTLGVVVEIEARLLPRPNGLLSGVVFFESESNVFKFVSDTRSRSLSNRKTNNTGLDARALEFFDSESLNFLRQKYPNVPAGAMAAVFFEQETASENEDPLMGEWMTLLEDHQAMSDSWFATSEQDQSQLREFRHQLPVLMNEWFARYQQRKVSTDMAVPDEAFPGMLKLYQDMLRASGLRYTIFGHIGDNHVHVNILPRNDEEGARARELYVKFLRHAASVGGTLSAEHGVGKLKRDYLKLFFSKEHLRQMARLKQAFDPNGILGRGNIFSADLLSG